MDINRERAKQLLESGIPLNHYVIVLGLTQDWDLEEKEDPLLDFKDRVLLLNKEKQLPETLSLYCERYRVQYNEPEIIIGDPGMDL